MPDYKIGDLIECRVTGIENYGFFVVTCDENKISGLVHISEMSDSFVKNVEDFVSLDEVIFAKVIDFTTNKKNLKLSIKNINYNTDGSSSAVCLNGFDSLKENLPKWISYTLSEIKKNS